MPVLGFLQDLQIMFVFKISKIIWSVYEDKNKKFTFCSKFFMQRAGHSPSCSSESRCDWRFRDLSRR